MNKTFFFNSNLQIVRIENKKLYSKDFKKYILLDGYFLNVEGVGLISFGNFINGILAPYEPRGGKKALEEILKGGGMLNYNNVLFVSHLQII